MSGYHCMYCFNCSVENPTHKIDGYVRVCDECGGRGVMTVMEMLDLLNDLQLKGLLPESMLADSSDTDYEALDLDFDNDTTTAYADALTDFLEDEGYD